MAKMTFTSTNIAANSTTANLLAGQTYEFLPAYDCQVALRVVSSASGIKLTAQADGESYIDDQEIPFIGTTLIDNEHVMDTQEISAGTRLLIRLRETAGVATTDVIGSVEITPLG